MAVIEVIDLRKSYGDVHAVRGVSFAVEQGECVAVLGPNGGGKTTTVEILEGYRTRDSGTVTVLGVAPACGGTEMRQRVPEVIDIVGLREKATARVKSLSGGQKRRLDVALGLIPDPELLFIDEPTTGFDPTARRQAWYMITDLKQLGKTVLLTTHYMDEAQALADRVIVISSGLIEAEGPPESIGGRADAAAQIRFLLLAGVTIDQLPVAADHAGDGAVIITTSTRTAACYTNLAFTVRIRRENGLLKRARGTPLSPVLYLCGIVGNLIAVALILTTLLVGLGVIASGVTFPGRYLALVLAIVVGAFCFSALGIAASTFVPNEDAAPAIINLEPASSPPTR